MPSEIKTVAGTARAARMRTWPRTAATLAASAGCGVLHTLAFAPHDWWWLQIIALAGLYAIVSRSAGTRHAALMGGAFGLGWFLSGIWWLYISMHTYGGMPAVLAGATLVLFSIYLALYPALAAGLTRRLAPVAGVGQVVTFTAAWVTGEWLRGVVFTGFPWLAAGYAHTDGPLAGFAPVLGVYGVSGIAAACAALLALAVSRLVVDWRRAWSPVLGLLILAGGGSALHALRWTQPSDGPLMVRLLQGNIPQEMKFERNTIESAMAWYRDAIIARPADLIVTPETAFPMLLQQIPDDVARSLRGFVDASGAHLVLGAVGVDVSAPGQDAYSNSLFGVSPRDPMLYRYDKHHLVPFGEFVPWGFRWFVDLMHIPLGDFMRGAPVQPAFAVGAHRAALDICYEDLFGEEIARTLREQKQPADVLVNASNLAWFGNTIALDQHLQIARMRALETGRPMLAATNTGATAIIDAHGKVQASLPYFTQGVLEGTVQPYQGLTPYIRYGNWPALLFAALALGGACGIAQRKKTR